jgi:hypothetical protein
MVVALLVVAIACSLLMRFIDDSFDEDQGPTIGVDFKTKKIDLNGNEIKLTIWDTAGGFVGVAVALVYLLQASRRRELSLVAAGCLRSCYVNSATSSRCQATQQRSTPICARSIFTVHPKTSKPTKTVCFSPTCGLVAQGKSDSVLSRRATIGGLTV